ncbi:3-keto-disaccharide hydrolase [Coraliomargarita sp. W4R53]
MNQKLILSSLILAGSLSAASILSAVPTSVKPAKASLSSVDRMSGEWVSLFDGRTLNGWSQRDGKAKYEVRDGKIVGTSVLKTPNSFLCSEATYDDFELEFEVKCGNINSGVQIRSHAYMPVKEGAGPQSRVNGPQVEIEYSPGQSGYVYGEASGGWRSPEPKSADPKIKAHSYFKNDSWNHYRIVAKGSRIQTWINGTQVADLDDPEIYKLYSEGFIGLQVHSHKQGGIEIEWRNIRIREID